MALKRPDFDFESYNPKDPWNFPGDRLVIFAMDALEIVRPVRKYYAPRYQWPDLRFGIFHELAQSCHSVLCLALWQRGEASESNWWHGQPEFDKDYARRTLQNFNIGVRGLAQVGLVGSIVFKLEWALRQVLEAKEGLAAAEVLAGDKVGIVQRLLDDLGLEDREPLMQLWWAMQNALHQNGNYCPADGEDLTLRYQGKFYTFLNNEEVQAEDWGYLDEWEFLLFLMRETMDMLKAIFDHHDVAPIPKIVMRHQQQRPSPGF